MDDTTPMPNLTWGDVLKLHQSMTVIDKYAAQAGATVRASVRPRDIQVRRYQELERRIQRLLASMNQEAEVVVNVDGDTLLWLIRKARGDDDGSAGVREPRRPRPNPSSGAA